MDASPHTSSTSALISPAQPTVSWSIAPAQLPTEFTASWQSPVWEARASPASQRPWLGTPPPMPSSAPAASVTSGAIWAAASMAMLPAPAIAVMAVVSMPRVKSARSHIRRTGSGGQPVCSALATSVPRATSVRVVSTVVTGDHRPRLVSRRLRPPLPLGSPPRRFVAPTVWRPPVPPGSCAGAVPGCPVPRTAVRRQPLPWPPGPVRRTPRGAFLTSVDASPVRRRRPRPVQRRRRPSPCPGPRTSCPYGSSQRSSSPAAPQRRTVIPLLDSTEAGKVPPVPELPRRDQPSEMTTAASCPAILLASAAVGASTMTR